MEKMFLPGLTVGLYSHTIMSDLAGFHLVIHTHPDVYDMAYKKLPPVPPEEAAYALGLAGNPDHGVVEYLPSIPNSYRIIIRHDPYSKRVKRSVTRRKAYGVVINGEFLTRAEYEKRYTHRGTLRASLPPPGVKRPRGRPRKNQPAALPSLGQEAGTAPASGNQLVVISRNQPATSSPVTQITTHLGPNPDHKTAHKTEHETEDGANAYTTTGSPQPQRAACIYRRLLDAGPIFYEVARSIGLIEDLQTAYHNPVLVNQMLSLSFHWLSTADNVARRYSLFARNHVLPFMGKMDEEFLASFYSGLSGMQTDHSG